MLSFNALVNAACRWLPHEWEIWIYLERGAGSVELSDESGDEVCHFCDQTLGLEEQVIEAVNWARRARGLKPADWASIGRFSQSETKSVAQDAS